VLSGDNNGGGKEREDVIKKKERGNAPGEKDVGKKWMNEERLNKRKTWGKEGNGKNLFKIESEHDKKMGGRGLALT